MPMLMKQKIVTKQSKHSTPILSHMQVNTAYEEYNPCGGIYAHIKIAQP